MIEERNIIMDRDALKKKYSKPLIVGTAEGADFVLPLPTEPDSTPIQARYFVPKTIDTITVEIVGDRDEIQREITGY